MEVKSITDVCENTQLIDTNFKKCVKYGNESGLTKCL